MNSVFLIFLSISEFELIEHLTAVTTQDISQHTHTHTNCLFHTKYAASLWKCKVSHSYICVLKGVCRIRIIVTWHWMQHISDETTSIASDGANKPPTHWCAWIVTLAQRSQPECNERGSEPSVLTADTVQRWLTAAPMTTLTSWMTGSCRWMQLGYTKTLSALQ